MILDEFLWKLGFLADTSGAQVATAALANVSSAADDAAGAVNQAASGVNKGTGSIVSSLGMWMAALSGVGAGIALLSGGLSSFIEDAVSQLEDLDETAGKSARSAVDEAKERLVEAGEQITSMFLDIRRQAILTVLPYLDAIVSKIREWYAANRALIEGTLTKLKDVIGRIGSAIGNTVSFIAKVIDHTTGWKAALALLAAGFIYLKRQMIMSAAAQGLALLMNPLTLVAAAIAALILLADDLMVYMEGGESLLGDFWKPFVGAIPGIKAWFQDVKLLFQRLWDLVVEGMIQFGNWMSDWWSRNGEAVTSFVVGALIVFGAFLSFLWQGVRGIFALLTGNWEMLEDIGAKTAYALSAIFEQLFTLVSAIAMAAWDVIKSGAAALVLIFLQIAGPVVESFSSAFKLVISMWDKTVGAITAGVRKVIGFFTSIGQSLGLLDGKTIEVAQKVAVTASATPGAVIGAQNAARPQSTNPAASLRTSQTGTEQSSNINQDVKMNIYTSDPERAGKAAADEMRRQQQLATRNAGGAVKY
ncbi:hypothetical protein [Laribacter hongkongensis]|uniref:hypothetical protein n=1 Tax=Laribacter hongkongensis TaxID=168471 RepID=UPI00041EA92F|nr:hypothetical protein [Laribacter hongkongensis]